jgi:23S rRNA (cytidine1920-2'-O)/16S rRNA (cytidine1409-2'-O)-methyltransferase
MAAFVVLVKPQFEAGPGDVRRGGVVRDAAVWRRVLDEVVTAFGAAGVPARGLMASPVIGPAGNVEFLLHACRDAPPGPVDLDAAVAEAEEVRGS